MGTLVYDIKEVPNKGAYGKRKMTKNEAILREFLNSGKKLARYAFTEQEYKTIYSAQHALTKTAKNIPLPVKIIVRKPTLIFENLEIDE